ncbi:hypothetical protein [Catellatospora citrea]|uniref:Uncharacterized protein n=1 Tax=Catellatospora citrea TaxID=53366 RepID=A0A8J3P0J1_9ACTN|nr:hypothetical protein [Catellatospora citrea]RKE09484.1 hypothetical protein C8E86_4372 [Catellatospora citrea]GIF97445.1 hypothetical protein Cci01nite_25390 [Catellatospora citrea]
MAELSVLVLIAVGLAVLVIAIHGRVDPPRILRFANRHGLDLTPERAASVERYLRLIRRRRSWGILLGGVIPLIWLLPEQRFAVLTVPVLAGWLLGAASAELAAGTATGTEAEVTVPAWLRRTPAAIAALALISTVLAVSSGLGDAGDIVAWGVGALVTCVFVTATVQHVMRRSPLADTARAVDLAARAHAVAAVTAVGLVLAMLCLLHQVDQVRAELEGQQSHWAGVVSFGLAVGMLFLTAALWSESAPGRRPRLVPFIAIVLVTASVAAVGFGVWQDRPPYGPEAVHPVATVRVTDMDRFEADAAALGVSELGPHGNWTVLGRLDLAVPRQPTRGRYQLIVIDRRYNRVVPQLYGRDGGGWGGEGLRNAWKRYPWLSALTPTQAGASGTRYPEGMAVSIKPVETSTGFVGRLPSREEAGVRPSDLLVALLFTGPQGQLYWAVQVPVTAA